MSEYKMYINKKRKPVEEITKDMNVWSLHEAVTRAYEYLQDVTDKKEFAEHFRAVARQESRAKILGYEACRDGGDTPIMHKKIREIERMRILLKKRYGTLV
jgi:hypothetical protein